MAGVLRPTFAEPAMPWGRLGSLRVSWVGSEPTGGPQPPRATPSRSIALCAARRCVAAFGRLARVIAPCAARRCVAALGYLAAREVSRLVQLSCLAQK